MYRDTTTREKSIYDIDIYDVNGKAINLASFKGKKLLIVNVASKCMYTTQYIELQELHEKFGDKLVVIGMPCNQFAFQEPGSNEEIRDFCRVNYGVSFTLTEKIDVKGEHQHPIYTWLTESSFNGQSNNTVEWNFQKYLISEEGKLLKSFPSSVSPMSAAIVKFLK